MSKISEFIEEKRHLYENGKYFDLSGLARTPEIYMAGFRNSQALKELPQKTKNKTEYRRPNPFFAVSIIEKEILEQLKSKTRLLEPYNKATPRNKLLYWGALFDTLSDFYIKNIGGLSVIEPRQQYIKQSEYEKMPKRYRSALKKTKKGYVVEKEPDAKKYRLMFNQADHIKFSKLMKEAKELIKSIYTDTVIEHELVGNSFRKTKNNLSERFEYKSIHGTMPSPVDRIDQYFITDKEVETVKKLKIIFREIQDMFYYFEHKSNAQETIYEYNDAQRRHNVVKDAQSVTRTAQQYVVSVKKASKYLDKYDVMAAEHAFENTKRQVLSGLKKQLDFRIQ